MKNPARFFVSMSCGQPSGSSTMASSLEKLRTLARLPLAFLRSVTIPSDFSLPNSFKAVGRGIRTQAQRLWLFRSIVLFLT